MKVDYLKKINEIVGLKGGECLSRKYNGSMQKLLFKCEKNHIWEATPNSIISKNSWCRICANLAKKDSIKTFQDIAQKRGGLCLSKEYLHSHQKLKFQCSNGHKFTITPANIKHNNNWCKLCNIEKQRSGLEECRILANIRGGECLSKEYKNQHTKMLWKCSSNHIWEARYMDIKTNLQWCPTCSSGIGERICRLFFEELFDCTFPKSYPNWLKNKSGNQMELDGYSKKFKLAFEHQGEQHYTSRIHYSNSDVLKKRIHDDLLKQKLCSQNGIILIAVPEIPKRLPIDNVKQFIYDQLIGLDISEQLKTLLDSFSYKIVDYEKAFIHQPLEAINDFVSDRGGVLLSKSYLGIFEKLKFRCENGHEFKKSPVHIIHRKQWCPECSKHSQNIKARKNIEDLRNLAIKRDGTLISGNSLGAHRNHLWQCSKGHNFSSTPANISQGKWCPTCAKQERSEKTRNEYAILFQKVINENEGEICEGMYENIKKALKLKCKIGHEWQARPETIFKGSWCPECKKINNREKYEFKLQKIIEEKGGTILKGKYETMRTKFLVQCKFGHEWSARADLIINGSWCSNCIKTKVS